MKYFLAVFLAFLLLFGTVFAEESSYLNMTVTASLVNGRAKDSKRSSVESRFDLGDSVRAIRMSKNHHWIEVIGGETGTVWIWWEYLTERTDEFRVWNSSGSTIKVRKEPFGTVIGYLKKEAEAIIDQVIFGWGRTERGWIDLNYTTEED